MTLSHYVALGSILFIIGVFGALTRRSVIGILMSVELMFNAANINLAAFNRYLHPTGVTGQAFALFIMTVAAAEVVVGLALVLAIYRRRDKIYMEDINLMRG
ncbi:MAG: NADH-quinone oxidoreductase subunit NuoK [Elusimicrobia bacterium]|nr:NADH-quinone oxidoreductase subunit NuoK [Elusimicrobiota bacterium]